MAATSEEVRSLAKKTDAKLAELHELRAREAHRRESAVRSLHHLFSDRRGKKWSLTDDEVIAKAQSTPLDDYRESSRERALTILASADGEMDLLGKMIAEQNAIFMQHQWSRFFIVQGGHIHSSMHCSTCNNGEYMTEFGWLPNLSGESEKQAVDAHGALLCTVCFPSAPVEWTNHYEEEAKRKAARECPGSRTLNYEASRKRYVVCNVCGDTVSRTSTGALRAHLSPEAKAADEEEKLRAKEAEKARKAEEREAAKERKAAERAEAKAAAKVAAANPPVVVDAELRESVCDSGTHVHNLRVGDEFRITSESGDKVFDLKRKPVITAGPSGSVSETVQVEVKVFDLDQNRVSDETRTLDLHAPITIERRRQTAEEAAAVVDETKIHAITGGFAYRDGSGNVRIKRGNAGAWRSRGSIEFPTGAKPVTKEDAGVIGKSIDKCLACNKALIDDRSRALGYGPQCAKKFS